MDVGHEDKRRKGKIPAFLKPLDVVEIKKKKRKQKIEN